MSAEDLVAVLRVHLDRVHDTVRRLGVGPGASVEVVETSVLDLVEAVADRPATVPDIVGWWFARAIALGRDTAGSLPELAPDGEPDQQVLAHALRELPETERLALLLRDAYDLPDVTIAAALGGSPETAMEIVGAARLALLPLVDGAPPPPVEHTDSLGALARLGQGGPVAPRDATARRHALSCPSCRAVTHAQQRAHLLLAGLEVVGMPESEGDGVLERTEAYAHQCLPSSADLAVLGRERYERYPDDRPRRFSPLLAVGAMVLAVLLGLGAGLQLSRDGGPPPVDSGALPDGGQLISPLPEQPGTPPPAPTVAALPPETRVFEVPPSPSPSPSPSPTPVVEELGIALAPEAGPSGQSITVTGTGWDAGVEVTVEYLDTLGDPTGSQAFAFVGDDGRFSVVLIAFDPAGIPGPHVVQATTGSQDAEASFAAGV